MDQQRLPDNVPHGHPGVEGGIGVLEDDLHLTAKLLQLPSPQGGHIDLIAVPLEEDLAPSWLNQPEDRAAASRLAAAGLPDQPQGLPLFDIEAYVINRLDLTHHPAEDPPSHREILLQILDLKERPIRGQSQPPFLAIS